MIKSTFYLLILFGALTACKTNSGSSGSATADQSLPTAPEIVKDAEFDQVFFSKIVPFIEAGSQGTFRGSKGVLEYVDIEKEGAKADVIVVHGFSQNYRSFSEVMYNLWNAGYAVHSYSHLGHGCSEHPLLSAAQNKENFEKGCRGLETKRNDGKTYYKDPNYCKIHVEDYYTYLNDLKTFVDRSKRPGRKTYLFCHSMGGGLCSRFIQDYPDAVDAAFLNAPMHTAKSEPFPNWVANLILKGSSNLRPNEYVPTSKEIAFEDLKFENADHTSRSRFDAERKISGIEAGSFRCGATNLQARELLELSRDVLKPENLAKVRIPVTIAAGGEQLDRWVEQKAIKTFCEGVANCRYRVYDNAKHEVYTEPDPIRIPLMQDVFSFYEDPQSFIGSRSKRY